MKNFKLLLLSRPPFHHIPKCLPQLLPPPGVNKEQAVAHPAARCPPPRPRLCPPSRGREGGGGGGRGGGEDAGGRGLFQAARGH